MRVISTIEKETFIFYVYLYKKVVSQEQKTKSSGKCNFDEGPTYLLLLFNTYANIEKLVCFWLCFC